MHTVSDKTEDAILVVSFGTSYNDSREKTIGAIETAIADAFPKWTVRRAFTSRMIIRKLRERDGYRVDSAYTCQGGWYPAISPSADTSDGWQ